MVPSTESYGASSASDSSNRLGGECCKNILLPMAQCAEGGSALAKSRPRVTIITAMADSKKEQAHRVQTGDWRAVRLLPRSRLQMIWLIAGPLLVLFCFFLLFPVFISKGDPRAWHWRLGALVGLLVPMFNYNLFGGPLFEEFGWRGFLQSQLQQVLPPWIAAICVGTMWAAWHLPLFLVGWSSASPLVFTFIVVGLSVLIVFAFNASAGQL
jgi:hypothetical protein